MIFDIGAGFAKVVAMPRTLRVDYPGAIYHVVDRQCMPNQDPNAESNRILNCRSNLRFDPFPLPRIAARANQLDVGQDEGALDFTRDLSVVEMPLVGKRGDA